MSVSIHVWGEFNVLPISLYRYPGVGAVEESVARDNADLSIMYSIIMYLFRFEIFLFWCVLSVGEKQKALSSIIIYRAAEVLVTVTTRADVDYVKTWL